MDAAFVVDDRGVVRFPCDETGSLPLERAVADCVRRFEGAAWERGVRLHWAAHDGPSPARADGALGIELSAALAETLRWAKPFEEVRVEAWGLGGFLKIVVEHYVRGRPEPERRALHLRGAPRA